MRRLAALGITALLSVACSGAAASPAPASRAASPAASQAASAPASGAGGGSSTVEIKDFTFTPSPISVAAGTTVQWTNADSAPHTVTFDDASITSSGNLNQGQMHSATFASAGTFSYKCAIHPSMKGEVTVS